MRYLYVLLLVVAGMGLPLQSAVNARLRGGVQSPILSALVSFLVGTVLLAVLSITGIGGRGRLAGAAGLPWWAWIGGSFGVLIVTAAIVGLPRIGAAGVVAASVFGQLLASLLMDHFGWLGVPRVPINGWRVLGAGLLFAGVLLMQRR